MDPKLWQAQYRPGLSAEPPALPAQHLGALCRQQARAYGPQPAFSICLPNGSSATLSYEQVDQLSDAFAAYLRAELRLAPGDRVALQLPNCLAYPVAAFGVLKAGCVLVNTNPLYTSPEMRHQFADSGAKALIIIDLFADRLAEGLQGTAVQHVILAKLTDFFPGLQGALIQFVLKYVKHQVPACPVAATPFSKALELGQAKLGGGADKDVWSAGLGPESLAALQYTGGTTGVSKGAKLSHGNLLANVEQAYQFCAEKITLGQELVLAPLPLYHVFAFTVNFLTFWRAGAHSVLVPSPRPISNLKAVFAKYAFTWMTGVNTLYAALLQQRWFTDKPPLSLKAAIAGGTALHQSVAEAWRDLIGDPPVEGYGLTEASPVISFNPVGSGNRIGGIGVPLPGVEIRILKEDGSEAGPDEAGELCARGPNVMSGYWQRQDETDKVLIDGWLHTGDVAVQGADGYMKIVDRLKDVIVHSGFKIFPNEVEDVLTRLDGVAEAAVIGAPAGDVGEEVRAYVVLKPGAQLSEAQVREHCKKSLTPYKVPRHVEFRAELPKTNVGKILRKALRAELLGTAKP